MPWRPPQPSKEQIKIREQRKAEWWRTPDPSKHPLYPANDKADFLVRNAKLQRQKAAIDDDTFFDKSVCSSSLLWKTFHFAFLSPVLNIDLREWFHIHEFVNYHNLEDDIHEAIDDFVGEEVDYSCLTDFWIAENGKLVDLDLTDAGGKIWKMRMVWVEGGGAMESFYGYYGKVFDREDPGRRVLFDINQGYQSETEFNRTEYFGEFIDHDNLKDIMNFLSDTDRSGDILSSEFYTFRRNTSVTDPSVGEGPDLLNQASFLMAMALLVARTNNDLTLQSQCLQDSTPFISTQLRLVCKPFSSSSSSSSSSQNDDDSNIAIRKVLCASDDLRGLIASYASEPYAFLPQKGSASRDNSMDWYTQRFRWLCHSIRCQKEEGDKNNDNDEKAAYDKFCRDEDLRDGSIIYRYSCQRSSPKKLKPWLLGMENDKTVFPPLSIEELYDLRGHYNSITGKRKERSSDF